MSQQTVSIEKLGDIVLRLNTVIAANKAWLSEIDGAIGDGDHGINMAKGFSMAAEQVAEAPGGFSKDITVLSRVLMMKIGGSMGPLYGMLFKALADGSVEMKEMGLPEFTKLVESAHESITKISKAKVGDKTLMDCLQPAVDTLQAGIAEGKSLKETLVAMKAAAEEGRDSTKDLVAKLGRSSRLGERSRGVLDAGACSCNLILGCLADMVLEQL